MVKMNPDELTLHPYAEVIPDMSGEERAELLSSLKSEGQLVPITITPEHVIVDGRHRWEAIKMLGWDTILCEVLALDGDTSLQYMVTTAVTRRHLSAGQKAAILIHYDEILQGAFQQQRQAGEKTRDILAKQAQVSDRTMQDAMTLKALSPQKFEEVKDGKVSVSQALRQVKGTKTPTYRFHDEARLRVLAQDVADGDVVDWGDWMLSVLEAMFDNNPAAAIWEQVMASVESD